MRWTLILAIVLLNSCAQQVPPNGGKKDETPPKIIGSNPKNKTTNFTSKKVILKFDEYIQIKDPNKIIISPILKNKPRIQELGKTIEIENLYENLEQNKTYTINFQNSIVDMNEGNPIDNYSYVFSTGSYLDSNNYKGKVIQAHNLNPVENIIIGLYNKNDFQDSTIFKKYPNYIGKSSKDGEFEIKNLPVDTFISIAFNDLNNDSKYQINEEIAFHPEKIITQNNNEISNTLHLFQSNKYNKSQLIDSFKIQKNIYQFVIFEPNHSEIKVINNKNYITKWVKGVENLDTLTVFITNPTDTNRVNFSYHYNNEISTFTLKNANIKRTYSNKLSIQNPNNQLDTLKITTNIPIRKIDKNKIFIKIDTTKIFPKSISQLSDFELSIIYPWPIDNKSTIIIEDSAFLDIYGNYTSDTKSEFTLKPLSDFGILKLNVQYSDNEIPIIIQLIEKEDNKKILKEIGIIKSQIITFLNIPPNTYTIKIIYDSNKNGKWDTGSFQKKIQPEKVAIFNNPISIKALWEIEQTIEVANP